LELNTKECRFFGEMEGVAFGNLISCLRSSKIQVQKKNFAARQKKLIGITAPLKDPI
jgi:hypothetical protein